jgi:hypothetical protein
LSIYCVTDMILAVLYQDATIHIYTRMYEIQLFSLFPKTMFVSTLLLGFILKVETCNSPVNVRLPTFDKFADTHQ